MFNPYLNQWVFTFLRGSNIVMVTADDIFGPWSTPINITNSTHHPGLYGGFLSQSLMSDGGRKMYMIISEWGPYQSLMLEILLK